IEARPLAVVVLEVVVDVEGVFVVAVGDLAGVGVDRSEGSLDVLGEGVEKGSLKGALVHRLAHTKGVKFDSIDDRLSIDGSGVCEGFEVEIFPKTMGILVGKFGNVCNSSNGRQGL
ncbi:hypothetical protein FOL47_002968, partial [Perkinsus chesapeaki]